MASRVAVRLSCVGFVFITLLVSSPAAGDAKVSAPCISPQVTKRLAACTVDLPRVPVTQGPDRGDRLAPKALTAKQRTSLAAIQRQLCDLKGLQHQPDRSQMVAQLAYARALILFDAHRWQEAAAAMRDVALNHDDTAVGIVAAQQYLKSLDALQQRRAGQVSCLSNLVLDVPKLISLYCRGKRAETHRKPCQSFFDLQRQLPRLKAEALVFEVEPIGATLVQLRALAAAVSPPSESPRARCSRLARSCCGWPLAPGPVPHHASRLRRSQQSHEPRVAVPTDRSGRAGVGNAALGATLPLRLGCSFRDEGRPATPGGLLRV